jgi:hypothetical protein
MSISYFWDQLVSHHSAPCELINGACSSISCGSDMNHSKWDFLSTDILSKIGNLLATAVSNQI